MAPKAQELDAHLGLGGAGKNPEFRMCLHRAKEIIRVLKKVLEQSKGRAKKMKTCATTSVFISKHSSRGQTTTGKRVGQH